MQTQAKLISQKVARPVLKWAGGKSQLLNELILRSPQQFNKYIEPFFGGGALFFHLQPNESVIADINPELINLYKCLANDPNRIIQYLTTYKNTEEFFYTKREQKSFLDPYERAARTIYLNKTCFNGLYRVNKAGGFNVPYGRYKNPNICDEENLFLASDVLQKSDVVCADYKSILQEHAAPGDFVFLDPPYLPISKYSDFKRYTKEQFYEEDHKELAKEVHRLHDLGCYTLLTNSNHPLVHDLYGKYKIEVIKTKRHISCNGQKRTGEDVIVCIPPKRTTLFSVGSKSLPKQVQKYPSTRWMGSKSKLLSEILEATKPFQFDSVLDLFSGSGIVGYMFKTMGKQVISNDYMALSATYSKAMVENSVVKLPLKKALRLLEPSKKVDDFVQRTFSGIYFTDEENYLIDVLRSNIHRLQNQYEKAIALSALVRACTKKRPRGIFTYTGFRYDDGRKDLQISLRDHFLNSVEEINDAIFDNGKKNQARQSDAMNLRKKADLVYIDPPYYSPLSDNEYVRRYHFIEGLACDWKDLEIQEHTKTKKFKSYPTPFSSRKGATDAFDRMFNKFSDSILVVSYSSNSLPNLDEMVELMSKYKDHVEVRMIDYKYSFGNQRKENTGNDAQEYIFVGY